MGMLRIFESQWEKIPLIFKLFFKNVIKIWLLVTCYLNKGNDSQSPYNKINKYFNYDTYAYII